MSRADLAARLRNLLRRKLHGIPSNFLSPAIVDARHQAHLALFDFLSAFTVRRKVLFVGTATAFGARSIQARSGAQHVLGIARRSAALRYAQKHYSSNEVTFAEALDHARRFDVVILSEPPFERAGTDAGRLEPGGKLLVAFPPGGERPAVTADLRMRFRVVRRFAQVPPAGLNLRAPRGDVAPDAFRIVELSGDTPAPAQATAVVLMATNDAKWSDVRLHVGCGPVTLDEWVNVDNQPYQGIDFFWDTSRGLPFSGVRFVFSEHFIEHLSYADAATFAALCRRVLRDDGILRLSTPNLDWVWRNEYRPETWSSATDAQRECFAANRAFRGWGHQFLYNIQTLTALLHNAGFESVRAFAHGESDTPELRGLEHHETYADSLQLPHVIVVEASGRRSVVAAEGEELVAGYLRDLAAV